MLKNKLKTLLACLVLNASLTTAQTLSLDDILMKIRSDNPQLKMYDAEIRSMDEAVKGSKSWMPPQLSTGFFMTPYDTEMWKADELNPGMGSYMLGIDLSTGHLIRGFNQPQQFLRPFADCHSMPEQYKFLKAD